MEATYKPDSSTAQAVVSAIEGLIKRGVLTPTGGNSGGGGRKRAYPRDSEDHKPSPKKVKQEKKKKPEKVYRNPHIRICYFCANPGHQLADCPDKLAGKDKSFPPVPAGTSWSDHVKNVAAKHSS